MAKVKNAGILSEERVAKALGGEPRMASGAVDSCKGDIALEFGHGVWKFLGECKATEGKTLRVDQEWLHKISKEALELERDPFLAMSFITGNGRAKLRGDWVAVPLRVFKELMLELEELQQLIHDQSC